MAGAFSKKKASGAHWEGVVAQQLLPIPVVAAVVAVRLVREEAVGEAVGEAVRLVREEEEEAAVAAAAAAVVAAAHPVRDSAVVVQVAAVGASW